MDSEQYFQLSNQIVSEADLARMIRELENVDDFLYQANIRTPGTSTTLPKTSAALNETSEINGLSLLEETKRKRLLEVLRQIEKRSISIHISFAAEPSNAFMQRVVSWSRENINSYLLINVGLQPLLAVGCEVRSVNKIFDLSLRKRLEECRQILVEDIRGGEKA